MSKIAVIRIKGMIGLRKPIVETLDRLRLKRKYACVVIEGTTENLGMVKKVRDFVAFGEINDETYKALVDKRGKKDADGKLKPFFRLHPPRGGIETKKHFGVGKGVLGNHKEKINELIMRML
ncbi:MAG: uL30 family ribosomal protein [Nanoarchaeota archaeon]|nr:uL30 family ribosomal protein [Nanoarchaeota archaeon]